MDEACDVRAVTAALQRDGVELLDVEHIRLRTGPLTDPQLRLADTAAALGALNLLVVSEDPDEAATAAKLALLAELLAGSGTRVALEFMAFTSVPRLVDAVRLAAAVPGIGVLVDPLHMHRGGDALTAVAGVEDGLVGYAQLCDARRGAPPGDLAAMAHEARHDRLPPGNGTLPLGEFLAALPPGIPLSIEVQSDRLLHQLDPLARARLVAEAARVLLHDHTRSEADPWDAR
jgi:sugar phosphate isomerase/epimerase